MSESLHAEQPTPTNPAAATGPQTGYLYRVCPADADRLRQLVTDIVGSGGWTFGGASVWDFDANLNDKRKNLRPIERIDPTGALNVDGDFGHAFSKRAEVRWKRLTKDSYDLLVLSETSQTIPNAVEIHPETVDHQTRKLVPGAWQVNTTKMPAIVQSDNRPGIHYREYHAPNGAVQFVRYTEVKP